MRIKGKITTWNDEKGFGFITPTAGGKQVFIHILAFSNRNRRPEINQLVTYALSTNKQGRPRAENVTLAGDKLREKEYRSNGALSFLSSGFFLVTSVLQGLTKGFDRQQCAGFSSAVPHIKFSVVSRLVASYDGGQLNPVDMCMKKRPRHIESVDFHCKSYA